MTSFHLRVDPSTPATTRLSEHDLSTQLDAMHYETAEAESARLVLQQRIERYLVLMEEDAQAMEKLRLDNKILLADRQAVERALEVATDEIAVLKVAVVRPQGSDAFVCQPLYSRDECSTPPPTSLSTFETRGNEPASSSDSLEGIKHIVAGCIRDLFLDTSDEITEFSSHGSSSSGIHPTVPLSSADLKELQSNVQETLQGKFKKCFDGQVSELSERVNKGAKRIWALEEETERLNLAMKCDRQDRARLQDELEETNAQAREDATDYETRLGRAEEAGAVFRKKIEAVEEANNQLRSVADQDKQDRMRLQDEIREQRSTNDMLKSDVQQLRSVNASLTQQFDLKRMDAQTLGNELQTLKTRHEETQTLLKTRTHELKLVQGLTALSTRQDSLSSADVVSLLAAFNTEATNTAFAVADSFDFSFAKVQARKGGVAEMEDARMKLQDIMGASLLDLLRRVRHDENSTLIQIALQSSIVEFSRWMISTWDYDVLQAEQPLMEVYQNIRETECQMVAGRWRALTRTHAQKVAFREDAHQTALLITNLTEALVLVLVAAGCVCTYDETSKRIASAFGARISALVDMATRLNRAMGAEVTSADLWPAYIDFGKVFNGDDMRGMHTEDGGAQKGQVVLCTTELGLIQSVKTQEDEFETTILVKPKVALENVTNAVKMNGRR
ncbi:hypothetical protein CONPUDRAFT_166080 [Coniophora puteana RWD-64-598 SS2]|uniref:Uncharacterized protein n=1 Tax=Coniophora puteana (strain RWD-64-598) TaxID=741705 RepID=A0A5M3MN34_CONPW|nr:uncharacterized protein CONPUDRAFT_166080 [Coniophora puteana RWD-64-598 SS2]EIW80592.1 hypothetical protein CONPUDRAFT_166080 [Coniophora puteana RWD-64-598 SS2]